MPRGHFLYEVGKEIQSVDVSLWESDTQVILTNNDSVDFLRRAMSHWRPLEDSGIFLFYFSFLAKKKSGSGSASARDGLDGDGDGDENAVRMDATKTVRRTRDENENGQAGRRRWRRQSTMNGG